jgi:hypothetical protein
MIYRWKDDIFALLEYLRKNKEWLFSGCGVSAALLCFAVIRWTFVRRASEAAAVSPGVSLRDGSEGNDAVGIKGSRGAVGGDSEDSVPREWQAIMPRRSKYQFVSETTKNIPLGLQSFSFEYGPQGHAKPLVLQDAVVQAEIEFTCRIDNPYLATFRANDYALNVLPPQFLIRARGILESYSLSSLWGNRSEASRAVVAMMAPRFQELGVRLESVTIGALERIETI